MESDIPKYLLKKYSFFKGSFIILIAYILCALFYALFYLYMGRSLGPGDYGILLTLWSLSLIVSISTSAIHTGMVGFISGFKIKNEYGKIGTLFVNSLKIFFLIGLFIFILISILSKDIASLFKIPSNTPVIILGLFILVFFIRIPIFAVLNGLQSFFLLAITYITDCFLLFSSGVLLVYFGFGINGAMLALLLGIIISFLLGLIFLRSLLFIKKTKIKKLELKYFFPVFIALIALALILNMDIILVKYFFTQVEAGYYAAASLLGKVIYFISVTLIVTLFPKVSELSASKKDASSLLGEGLKYTLYLALFILFIYLIAPNFIVNLLFGVKYKIANLILPLAIAIFFLALSNIMVMYDLAIKRFKFLYLLIPSIFLETLLIVLFHKTLFQVITVLLIFMVFIFIVLLLINRKDITNIFIKKVLKDV